MQAHSVRVEVSCPPRNLSICSQLALLAALVYLAITNAVFAQPLIEEEEGLDFGTLAVSNNTSISRFTYPNTGRNISSEGQFVHIERGTVGEYRLTGFPAFTPLSVSLNNASLYPDSIAVTEPLTVDNFDINDVLTNSQGQASLLLGARLSTTGNGAEYADSTYSGATMIRVEYWEPEGLLHRQAALAPPTPMVNCLSAWAVLLKPNSLAHLPCTRAVSTRGHTK